MRLYRNLYLLPKCLGAPVTAAAQTQFHSAAARQLIRLDAFRGTNNTINNIVLYSSSSAPNTPPMSKLQAFEVVQKLTDPERQALSDALRQFESDRGKIKLEGKRILFA